ncbi:hypothetical protein ACKWTF_005677 [Chironomus riparius]
MRSIFYTTVLLTIFTQGAFGLFCHKCIKSANNTCMLDRNPPQTELDICPDVPENERQLGAGPLCYKVIKTTIVDTQEKVMASRGCFYGGGSVTSEVFCTNITKTDPDADCHFCRADACNKADGIDIFKPLVFMTVILNSVVGCFGQ